MGLMDAPEMMTPEMALESYRPLVEDNDQALPILVYATKSVVQPIGLTGVPQGAMQQAVAHALQQVRETLGPPIWLVFSVEAHMKMMEREELSNFRPGDLGKEAETNPDMGECVQIIGVSKDSVWAHMVPFVRTKNGLTWDEGFSGPAVGGIPDILIEAITD